MRIGFNEYSHYDLHILHRVAMLQCKYVDDVTGICVLYLEKVSNCSGWSWNEGGVVWTGGNGHFGGPRKCSNTHQTHL